jgi:acyl-CoA oxidase
MDRQEASLRRTKVLFGQLHQTENEEMKEMTEISPTDCYGSSITEEMSTLLQERANCPFDVSKISEMLYGENEMKHWKDVATMIERDSILNDGLLRYDFSRPEERLRCTQKFFRVADILANKDEEKDKEWLSVFSRLLETFDPSLGMRLFVHYKLWVGTIMNQGTPEQQKKWLYDSNAKVCGVIGCFGMTELGYSSHLRGSETIATFDEQTDEFVINSTSIKATKVWIGLAGQIATHCIVFANLVSKGKPCGIQLFIVPIRDPRTGLTLPGVAVGDLGSKAARNGLDNGWLQFTNVRVPRENMLARWAQVSRNGEFVPPPSLALAYGSTVTERVGSAESSLIYVDPCLVIAVRYSAIRKQGPKNTQIIDYQTHQHLLMPTLATSYAIHFASERTANNYRNALKQLHSGNNKAYLKLLPDLHGLSCGMKVVCGWWGIEGLEACRRAMGGHAYHSFSSIPNRTASFWVVTTGGGDNYVLSQQSAGYLLKILHDIMSGKKPDGDSIRYLVETGAVIPAIPPLVEKQDLVQLPRLLAAYKKAALYLLHEISNQLQSSLSEGSKARDAFNQQQVAFLNLVHVHINHFILETFVNVINTTKDAAIRQVMQDLCTLFALHTINKNVAPFIEAGVILSSTLSNLRQCILEYNQKIRRVAVPLVDAYAFPDFILMSPLGRSDGNIYHAYHDAMKNARGGSDPVAPFWDELVKPRVWKQDKK